MYMRVSSEHANGKRLREASVFSCEEVCYATQQLSVVTTEGAWSIFRFAASSSRVASQLPDQISLYFDISIYRKPPRAAGSRQPE